MPAIQLLAHPGSLPSSSFLKGDELATTRKTPFYLYLRLDQFHLVTPGIQANSGVTSTWWAGYAKKTVTEKLKMLKQLLSTMVTEQPPVREDDESGSSSRAAVAGLKTAMDDADVEAEEEEEEPSTFQMAQRSSVGMKAPRSHGETQKGSDDDHSSDTEKGDLGDDVDMSEQPEEKPKTKPKDLKEKLMVQTTLTKKSSSSGSTSSSSSPPAGKKGEVDFHGSCV